ncbi:hypothetical protein BT63DRAFT_430177 [Microthyrium microscopicum]|uniref:t-SNARE coiled-coil homology domain-containing protein n=1 Tax=Microthyrium microscopicum TaxID=703497 RepID=A0A6A6TW08_9PEZI|nr:hypothetical protein BT63DRAFT_430177 [Microthyrium microscopicum]
MDITPLFSTVLSQTTSPPLQAHPFDLPSLTTFLQEAYRINTHISSLAHYLRSIRAPYLALSNTTHTRSTRATNSNGKSMSDADRKHIDTETKTLLTNLSSAIASLSAAATADAEARAAIAQKSRNKGLGALGRWAAGGGAVVRSLEEREREEREETVRRHREGVVWFLQKRLEAVSEVQWGMVAVRLQRAVERNKSVLYKGMGDGIVGNGTMGNGSAMTNGGGMAARAVEIERQEKSGASLSEVLSPEQVQMFEAEQEDMVRYYNSELQKIRAVENSLVEISSLQTELAMNLEMQSENITQLVSDSVLTTENVGQGNKELKKASERASTARMVFWSTCGFCTFLVVWDLIF